ncbi:MAG TPA: Hsp20/alpha crystallin family protein [Thermoanaerobaculia bacterium]|nr:Hsp20/alpha crystallin family protein [Thermoanaerobaculia bacterium]
MTQAQANTNLTRSQTSTSPIPNVWEQFFDDSFFGPSWLRGRTDQRSGWFPSVDLSQTTDRFLIKVDLPGLKKDDIELTVENQTLTVTGERRFDSTEEGETFNRIERSYGKFSRTFQLPSNVNSGKVKAAFADGVLTITIPKNEEAKSRKISIG